MREEYDFSKGERGKFYRPDAELHILVYLERDVAEFLKKLADQKGTNVEAIVNDWLRRSISFDYRRAGPNRFARRFAAGSLAVVLDPDVASVFRTSESVNLLLRSVLAAMQPRSTPQRVSRRGRRSKKSGLRGTAPGKSGRRR